MAKMFFAEDGSWGSAEGITIIDTAGLDDHFDEYIESVREYDLSEWAAWFVDNNHPMPADSDGECYYCDSYELGSLTEIDAHYTDEEE
jgi:hypothetical protein